MGPGCCYPTNQDLADILGRTDLNFEMFYFFHFLDPKFPDAAAADSAAAADGQTLRSQPDPSPNAPRDQIRRKGPCCDKLLKLLKLCTKVGDVSQNVSMIRQDKAISLGILWNLLSTSIPTKLKISLAAEALWRHMFFFIIMFVKV